MGSEVFVLILLLLSVVLVVAAVRKRRPAQSTARRAGTAAEIGSLTIPRNTTNSFTRAEQLRDQLYTCCEQATAADVEAIGLFCRASEMKTFRTGTSVLVFARSV